MLARGYAGVMPDETGRRATGSEWAAAGALPLLGVLVLTTALVVT